MLEQIPSPSELEELLGQSLFEVWQALCSVIDEKYEMDRSWNTGGKNGPMSINTAEAAKHFAACTPNAAASVF